jgi:hypothetical protein
MVRVRGDQGMCVPTGATGLETRDLPRDRRGSATLVTLEFRADTAMGRLGSSYRSVWGVVRVMTGGSHRSENPCSAATSYYAMGM